MSWIFQPLVPASAQLQSTTPPEVLAAVKLNNYQFIKVGDGMSTTERIR